MSEQPKGSVLIGFLWMFFLSILLVWLPVIGQFIAGFVGGKRAGGVGSALLAFFLPAIVFSLLFIWIFPLIPVIGISLAVLLVFFNFSLFCGAIVGGALNS